MEKIIAQILVETLHKYLDYGGEKGISDIGVAAEDFKEISDEMANKILVVFAEAKDVILCNAKMERKADKITIQERNVSRTLLTALGDLTYKRSYFNMADGSRKYLLDDIIGVEAYDRIDSSVSAKLVNAAATHSFGQSANIVTKGELSRQSVRNKVMGTGELSYVPEQSKQTPKILHIFADEDHVHLQDGANTVVPLITVCEGKKQTSKNRNELINPFHIQGYGLKPATHWEYVYALCAEKYDIDSVKKIYIYGDGASWIMKCFDVFPEAVHILDEFHLSKTLKRLFAGDICCLYAQTIKRAIYQNNQEVFRQAINEMLLTVNEQMREGKEKKARIKSITENSRYILSFWGAIQNIRLPDSIGSCTEAMVSNILSARFSRNPMGWSRAGLSKMSMLRIFIMNGEKVEAKDISVWKDKKQNTTLPKLNKYEKLIEKQEKEVLKNLNSWRWFERDCLISGKKTGTKIVLDALGEMRNVR